MDAAIKHCASGIGIWAWASTDAAEEPNVAMACAGDVPTLETLAAVELLRQLFPELKVRLHVRGYKEEGTTTTPFDMAVLNDLDRFHLVGDVIDRVPGLSSRAAYVKQLLRDKLTDHTNYIHKHGEDMPEIRNWKWGSVDQVFRR